MRILISIFLLNTLFLFSDEKLSDENNLNVEKLDVVNLESRIRRIKRQISKETDKDETIRLNNKLNSVLLDKFLYETLKKSPEDSLKLLLKNGNPKTLNKTIDLLKLEPLNTLNYESVLSHSIKEYFAGDIRKLENVIGYSDTPTYNEHLEHLKILGMLERGTGKLKKFSSLNLKLISSVEINSDVNQFTYISYIRTSKFSTIKNTEKQYRDMYLGGILLTKKNNHFKVVNRSITHSSYFRELTKLLKQASLDFYSFEKCFSSYEKYLKSAKDRHQSKEEFILNVRKIMDKEAQEFLRNE